MILPDLDLSLAKRLFSALYEAGYDGVGITRDAYGPGENLAHHLVRLEADAVGLDTSVDFAGNLHMTLPGHDRSAKRILLGSHLDSVARGGNYDGAAGVVAGLVVLSAMKKAGMSPRQDVTAIAVRAEESGSWFPVGYPGSRAALGMLPQEALRAVRLDNRRSLEDHMRECGCDIDAIIKGHRIFTPDNVAAYLELHIEQGSILEDLGIPVGIVSAIPSSRRVREGRVIGSYNHSGATSRRGRQDAAIALAELAVRMDQRWEDMEKDGRNLVCTFCVLATTEHASLTKVPGEARFQLDIRSADQRNVDSLFGFMKDIIKDIEVRRNVRFELKGEGSSPRLDLDAHIQHGMECAARDLGIGYTRMASGGGHDPVAFSEAGVPAGLLFIRNQFGSHNPKEAMRMDDFAEACRVVQRWLLDEH